MTFNHNNYSGFNSGKEREDKIGARGILGGFAIMGTIAATAVTIAGEALDYIGDVDNFPGTYGVVAAGALFLSGVALIASDGKLRNSL